MKKEYLDLEMEIIEFDAEDIIITSSPEGGDNSLPFIPPNNP